jgi:hypothetical protein
MVSIGVSAEHGAREHAALTQDGIWSKEISRLGPDFERQGHAVALVRETRRRDVGGDLFPTQRRAGHAPRGGNAPAHQDVR